jgi:hypothetical protein
MNLPKSIYNYLEFTTDTNIKPERPASEDIIDLMRIAVDNGDKQWYEELCQKYNTLKVEEELVKAELGFIG